MLFRSAFNAQGNTHASTDAKRGKPFVSITLLHFEQQCDKHPGT